MGDMIIKNIAELHSDLISEYFSRNARHFAPWEPIRNYGFHAKGVWKERSIEAIASQVRGDSRHTFAVAKDAIIGHCVLTQIVKGPFQACYMGYGVDWQYQGKNVAYQLCQSVIELAFNEINLHRIMANYMPHNNRSAKLLARLGFEIEGVAKDYLCIQGKWENHVLTSLTNRQHSMSN